jgi:hypothetical protein
MLKTLMTFAKGFRMCFPEKKIITNNLFEIMTFGVDYDVALLTLNENSAYTFDKTGYYFTTAGNNIYDIVKDKNRIITNSKFLVDLLKNKHIISVRSCFDDETVVNLNYVKIVKEVFDDILEPLYIREPGINLGKK